MSRRRETQKRGRRGGDARSAPARRGARGHPRRRGSRRRQTFARLALRGPAPAAPRPLAAAPTARLCCHQKEGVRAQQRDPGSRRPLSARPRVGGWVGAGRPGGFGGQRTGVTDEAPEPRQPPPPPTQLTCHPRPRYSGQRDSGRKSHSGSPLIGPVRAAAPSLRGGTAGLDWTSALSVRPRAAPSLPPRAPAGGSVAARPPGARGAHVECGWWGEAAERGPGRLECTGDVSRLAAGRDAADTRDSYIVGAVFAVEPEMPCPLSLAPSSVLGWMRVCPQMAGRESGLEHASTLDLPLNCPRGLGKSVCLWQRGKK
nr:uncharacterized protein LOC111769059 [Equus caballus]